MNKTNPEGLPTMYNNLDTQTLTEVVNKIDRATSDLAEAFMTLEKANGVSEALDRLWLTWGTIHSEQIKALDELGRRA